MLAAEEGQSGPVLIPFAGVPQHDGRPRHGQRDRCVQSSAFALRPEWVHP